MSHQRAEQPTLTDGSVTLRPHAGDASTDRSADPADLARFVVEVDGEVVGTVELRTVDQHTGELTYALDAGHRGHGWATRAVRVATDWALTEEPLGGRGFSRVQAQVDVTAESALRVATRSGLRREGLKRVAPGTGERPETEEYVVLARLASDPPLSEPGAFRSLLNSFLPRKRAISQMLIRDESGRVLCCQLTYKQDWDLPGGVVEVGESPQLAVSREVTEELALSIPAGPLVLTDWLPPWGGWDDALCLVFDGGVVPAAITEQIVPQAREIRTAEFLTPEQVAARCADFTARRIAAALANLGSGPAYTESGMG
ncbi:NUDIX hydrolase [Nocardioides rubriscoriae]|uniref:NUDIX hydrolase n=1 Tax=Nocardioides rubriscoriae TaxID=642762 RepID=UPI0014786F84|nr:NUDIX hydrolase [Nocardioides rubriscoriae]